MCSLTSMADIFTTDPLNLFLNIASSPNAPSKMCNKRKDGMQVNKKTGFIKYMYVSV